MTVHVTDSNARRTRKKNCHNIIDLLRFLRKKFKVHRTKQDKKALQSNPNHPTADSMGYIVNNLIMSGSGEGVHCTERSELKKFEHVLGGPCAGGRTLYRYPSTPSCKQTDTTKDYLNAISLACGKKNIPCFLVQHCHSNIQVECFCLESSYISIESHFGNIAKCENRKNDKRKLKTKK